MTTDDANPKKSVARQKPFGSVRRLLSFGKTKQRSETSVTPASPLQDSSGVIANSRPSSGGPVQQPPEILPIVAHPAVPPTLPSQLAPSIARSVGAGPSEDVAPTIPSAEVPPNVSVPGLSVGGTRLYGNGDIEPASTNFHAFVSDIGNVPIGTNVNAAVPRNPTIDSTPLQPSTQLEASLASYTSLWKDAQGAHHPESGRLTIPTTIPEPEAMDVHEVESKAIPQTSSASAQVSEVQEQRTDTPPLPLPNTPEDLVGAIKGMYRILDLVSEQGSGGLVDKVIISQDSLGRLMNDLVPGAYISMTKVSFAALDRVLVNPVGIYGSKSEIIRYLHDIAAIDDQVAKALHLSSDEASNAGSPVLRSGLYFLRSPNSSVIYVIYWPQDTTWDDSAITSVVRNRVTFMRYLTKISDQLIVLISDEHGRSIIWNEEKQAAPVNLEGDDEDDDDDRMYTFHVTKTNEQEEDVKVRAGFKVKLPSPPSTELPDDGREIDLNQFQPRLVAGETLAGYMTTTFENSKQMTRPFEHDFTIYAFQNFLEKASFRLSEELSEPALIDLLNVLQARAAERFGQPLLDLRRQRYQTRKKVEEDAKEKLVNMKKEVAANNSVLVRTLKDKLADLVLEKFSHFDRKKLVGELPPDAPPSNPDLLSLFFQLYPNYDLEHHWKDVCDLQGFTRITKRKFSSRKAKLLSLERKLRESPGMSEAEQKKLLASELGDTFQASRRTQTGDYANLKSLAKATVSFFIGNTTPADTFISPHVHDDRHEGAGEQDPGTPPMDDPTFFSKLPAVLSEFQVLRDVAMELVQSAHEQLGELIYKKANEFANEVERVQTEECNRLIKIESSQIIKEQEQSSRLRFLSAVKNTFVSGADQVYHVSDVSVVERAWGMNKYTIRGFRETRTEASLQHTIFLFGLTETDRHSMQLDPSVIPSPKVHEGSSFSFKLPLGHKVLLVQLLQDNRCLIAVQNVNEDIKVFFDRCDSIANAIEKDHLKKILHRDKIGGDSQLAYDETKRMLVVCAVEKHTLHVFVFDEKFDALQGLGPPIELRAWYSDGQAKIIHAAFVCGSSEELILIDDERHARIYSLTTQAFRPASVQLQQTPKAMYSSPDASCLFVLEQDGDEHFLRAYHWSNFGNTDGISLPLASLPLDSVVVTSVGSRSRVYLIGLDNTRHSCNSVALDITRKVTEFTFKEKGSQISQSKASCATAHNILIDCHLEVWTRFPVVPAVRRRTIKSSSGQLPHSITFVSSQDTAPFQSHFADLIDTFERTTRKPSEAELSSIAIHGITYGAFMEQNSSQKLSTFKAGEWLVDLLCLIPIHIAVTRDNRFIPLKDGVWSAQVERDFLGATVDQIIDGLSFGWYESIFQSYMATKPVKVVSSMGEQSVGKSFALNHLVDTSFAGSAMRTTEGVWMSVTPTDDTLIVALDFEGVHSIERSAQEDSLLVLFNTAMSNLVLFRNNFAMSRDITGLFQSFQSSSTVLDPSANPSLFQSRLVIIIKDVVDSDKNEITKEFSLKFQKIVELEQASNFITMLHAGNLTIIPWPVIESRQFYTLFPRLKKLLDKQKVTHSNAAIFLQTMKTMMAKLKINDWGSLDQNLASHRAQQLIALLPRAMKSGALELDPNFEPLKDFDTGRPIDMPDSSVTFFIPDSNTQQKDEQEDEQEKSFKALLLSWERYDTREDEPENDWAQGLSGHLDKLANDRIGHVQEWLGTNTLRFKSDSTEFEALRRQFDALSVALKESVRLCKQQCQDCQLFCIQPRHHEGPHDCYTSHSCHHDCQYDVDHVDANESCGLPAGHTGAHICDISEHLCGQPCALKGRGGCLERCSKGLDHFDGEHLCPALIHECSQPCSLVNITLEDGSRFSCRDTCRISANQPHNTHVCENRSCPLPCQLCKRLCASPNHLHALEDNASHLCGQEHACPAMCQSKGICKIETAPQSVEATFTGKHETFQYTKYTQVSKRLPCVIQIPVGKLAHAGNHVHSAEKNLFHHCEQRCEHCGYFCTQPLGHTQQEHETSHGSMSRTKWTVDGPEDTTLEVDGRKFGTFDDGAPMLCSMVCRSMGRHVHIDFCRSEGGQACSGADLQHITTPMVPEPRRPKDFISHSLFWRRAGFKGMRYSAICDNR